MAMARIRNEQQYNHAKKRLLEIGVALIRSNSFKAIGINDILKAGEIPKGSFYHYFKNKEAFGIEVAQHYHSQQMAATRKVLSDTSLAPYARLSTFFTNARKEFIRREFTDGCLMCNLSTELGDSNTAFQVLLAEQWNELTDELANCIAKIGTSALGVDQLTDKEAADWLLNNWSGALTRMKVTANDKPLLLFEKTLFCSNA